MKAILIDPWAKEITEVQIPSDSEKQMLAIYHQLSSPEDDWVVEQVEQLRVAPNLYLLVDEEPFLKHTPPSFQFSAYGLIYGKALVVSVSNNDEDWVAPRTNVAEIKELIRFNA